MKTIKAWDEIPLEIREQIDEKLTEDILRRYDNSEYHDRDLIAELLKEHGLELENLI